MTHFPLDFDFSSLPSPDTALFWGFVIAMGFGVAQISTQLSNWLLEHENDDPDDAPEDIEADL
jgi:hypothetical protein